MKGPIVTLSPEQDRLIRERVRLGEFESPEAFVRKAVERALRENGAEPDPKGDIWDAVEELWSRASPDVQAALERLPSDLASEHDHYIYGTPKRSR